MRRSCAVFGQRTRSWQAFAFNESEFEVQLGQHLSARDLGEANMHFGCKIMPEAQRGRRARKHGEVEPDSRVRV